MLNFILSKLAVWGLLGVPFFLVARWIFRANSAQLNWFTYLIIIYLSLIVLQGWIEDWNAVCAQREARMEDGRRCAEEENRCRRANVSFNQESFLANEREWDLLNRGHDPL